MNILYRIWRKLPVLVRAIIGGFVVQIIGFLVLMVTIPANFQYLPSVPWAVLPLALGLWGYWSYFGGKGRPVSTAGLRHHYRRSHPLSRSSRFAISLATSLFAVTVACVSILQLALWETPPEALGAAGGLTGLPLTSSIPLALLAAFFVGVGEEMSFRGYMQVPIEDRHGPLLGLTLPAFFFALAHGLDLHVLPIFFVVSLGWGFIAWRANSIRPGIVAHTVIDAAAFLWAIFDLNGVKSVLAYSIADNGFTPGYRALAIATAACALATLGALAYMRQRLASQS